MKRLALFVSGAPGDTRRYRVDHPAEALTLLGWGVRAIELESPGTWDSVDIGQSETIILHRVAWSPEVERAIGSARRRGGTVLFDTDDLIFAPEAEARFEALRSIEAGSRGGQIDPIALGFAEPQRYLETIMACDGCLAASAPIAEAVIELGQPAHVVANAIDLELLRLSTRARAQAAARRRSDGRNGAIRDSRAHSDDRIVIGYASGTATHDRDLEVAMPALRSLLANNSKIVLRLMGHVASDGRWSEFGDRVELVPYMQWRRLPEALSALDIAIAPLEKDDIFARAKSELKFIEAGAVGVPIVATPIPAFRSAIRDGVDGLLATTAAEWESALGALVGDAALRRSLGTAARSAVLDRWVTDMRAAEIVSAIDRLRSESKEAEDGHRSSGSAQSSQSLKWSHSSQSQQSSEPEMARVVEALNEAGSNSTAAFVDDGRPPIRIALGVRASLRAPADLLLLDGEPAIGRHAMGDDLMLARRALSGLAGHPYSIVAGEEPLLAGGFGSWLPAWLARAYGTPTLPGLPYPLDARIYGPGIATADRDPIVALEVNDALHLPDSALGLATIERIGLLAPEAEFVVFGGRPIEEFGALVAAVEQVGARWAGWLDAQARAKLFQRSAAIVIPTCASTPPSVIQAMACGCAVVAPDVGATRWLLVDGQTAATAPPRQDTLARAAAAVLRDTVLRERIAMGASAMVERMSTGRTAAALAAHFRFASASQDLGTEVEGGRDTRNRGDEAGGVESGPRRDIETVAGEHEHRQLFTEDREPVSLPPAAGALLLDRLQGHSDEHTGPRLEDGGTAGQSFIARFDGLCRFDIRLRRTPSEAGRMRLTLRAHAGALEIIAGAEHAGPFAGGRWLPFEFGPLADSGGRTYYAEFAWLPDLLHGPASMLERGLTVEGVGPPAISPEVEVSAIEAPEIEALAVDAFADGRSMRDGVVEPSLTLAFRTWCRLPEPDPIITGRAIDREMADALQLAARREIAIQRDLSQLESSWPFRLAAWLSPSPPPLPPLDERPWRPEAPLPAKLFGTLRYFGPAALLNEVMSFSRWRKLSDLERDAANSRDLPGRVGRT